VIQDLFLKKREKKPEVPAVWGQGANTEAKSSPPEALEVTFDSNEARNIKIKNGIIKKHSVMLHDSDETNGLLNYNQKAPASKLGPNPNPDKKKPNSDPNEKNSLADNQPRPNGPPGKAKSMAYSIQTI
jgi:hypothetical protein